MAGPNNILVRAARRGLFARASAATPARGLLPLPLPLARRISNVARTKPAAATTSRVQSRWMNSSSNRNKGLSPDSEEPNPKRPEDVAAAPKTAAPLDDAEYHELADEYLDTMLAKFEELQDHRPDVDVEYSAGVMTLTFPPNGTYVINKQPPNKQIWLSSPVTGPKRYDWVVIGDGQNEKEGTASGDWIYLRDGTSLSQLILEELNVDITAA